MRGTLLIALSFVACASKPPPQENDARAAACGDLRVCCDAGDAASCEGLGHTRTREHDEAGGAAAFERACELGLFTSCCLAGLYHRERDPERSKKLYERGIALGKGHCATECSCHY